VLTKKAPLIDPNKCPPLRRAPHSSNGIFTVCAQIPTTVLLVGCTDMEKLKKLTRSTKGYDLGIAGGVFSAPHGIWPPSD